jgi:hypothetical protein
LSELWCTVVAVLPEVPTVFSLRALVARHLPLLSLIRKI